jgi:hypothetical protein
MLQGTLGGHVIGLLHAPSAVQSILHVLSLVHVPASQTSMHGMNGPASASSPWPPSALVDPSELNEPSSDDPPSDLPPSAVSDRVAIWTPHAMAVTAPTAPTASAKAIRFHPVWRGTHQW